MVKKTIKISEAQADILYLGVWAQMEENFKELLTRAESKDIKFYESLVVPIREVLTLSSEVQHKLVYNALAEFFEDEIELLNTPEIHEGYMLSTHMNLIISPWLSDKSAKVLEMFNRVVNEDL